MGVLTILTSIAVIGVALWAWSDSDESISVRGYGLMTLVATIGLVLWILEALGGGGLGSVIASGGLLWVALILAMIVFIIDISTSHTKGVLAAVGIGTAAAAKHQENKRKEQMAKAQAEQRRIEEEDVGAEGDVVPSQCPRCNTSWGSRGKYRKNYERIEKGHYQCEECGRQVYTSQ